MAQPVLLYDRDCGFCRWCAAAVLRRDRRRELVTAAIQGERGRELLASLPETTRLQSWHLAEASDAVYSGGDAFVPLLRALGRPAAARVGAAFASPLRFGYRQVANRRAQLGRLVSRAAVQRADEIIAARTLDVPAAPEPLPAGAPVSGTPPAVAAPPAPAPPAVAPPAVAPPAVAPPAVAPPAVAPPVAIDGPPGLQQRIEQSAFGRGLISTAIVVSLVAIVAINLPDSELRRDLLSPGQPYLNVLGLDQNWALFAPNPRRVIIDVSASIAYDDGRQSIWTFPHDGALIGAYRDYRWRKWEENLINPANAAPLWRQAALWAAAQSQRPGHAIASVALVERYASLLPPGAATSTGPQAERVFYVLNYPPVRSGA